MYYKDYDNEFDDFDSFKKTSRKKPRDLDEEKLHHRSRQDTYKTRRKIKVKEKKKIMKFYQSGKYDD